MKAIVTRRAGPGGVEGLADARARGRARSAFARGLRHLCHRPGNDRRLESDRLSGHSGARVVGRRRRRGTRGDAALLGKPCVAENVLADGGEVGFEHPGGYGQYLVTEARNIYLLPERFPPATAALIEPLAVCVRAVGRLRLEDRRSALVFGDGPIGLLMLMLLRRMNVEQIALVGGRIRRDWRWPRVRGHGRAQLSRGGREPGAVDRRPAWCAFANVIEASGSPAGMHAALGGCGACRKDLNDR